jgi:NAD(P)-dependent dehydrogenase (short-subunit alcohol dehydrogenase family)
MGPLSDKVAIVTGRGSGIGEGLCREMARRGARVVVARSLPIVLGTATIGRPHAMNRGAT